MKEEIFKIRFGSQKPLSEWIAKEEGSFEDSGKSKDHVYFILINAKPNAVNSLTKNQVKTLLSSAKYQSSAWEEEEIVGGKKTLRSLESYVNKFEKVLNQ